MSRRHHRRRLTRALVLMGALSAPLAFGVAPRSAAEGPRNLDARITHNTGVRRELSAVQRDKEAELRRHVPELRLEHDVATGVLRSLTNPVGALSGPRAGDALLIALDFVQSQRELLGLELEDLGSLEVTDRVYSRQSGVTHLYLRQTHQGLPVYNGQLQVNVDGEGRIVSVHSDFLPALGRALTRLQPRLGAAEAVASVARHLGVRLATAPRALGKEDGPRQKTRVEHAGLSAEPIEAQLMVLPVRVGEAQLVWNFQVHTLDSQHVYDFTVDAATGDVWTRFDWVAADTYEVYAQPVESPNHTTPLPPANGRVTLLNPADVVASPFGWHDTNGVAGPEFTLLRGNNVHAYEDSNNDGLPPAVEPDCGVSLNCSFPINLSGAPNTYVPAAVTNLFYWNNILHDVQYQYGFDEVGGNFQVNNYGNPGLGSDDVRAEAQDGSGMNNANFFTPPDGSRPRMQMFNWNTVVPNKDGDLDSGIIAHEYGHGISNRLVGGPSNVSCLGNAQQPGEGLSDFLSLVYTALPAHTGPQGRGVGTYALNQPVNGPGIRTQRYSTDPTINTWTYASINGMAVPHGVGSVFAQALWEAYWSLVDRWGFSTNLYNALGSAGNNRMLLYYTEGLKNTACSPTFTQVRDGIIAAATTLHSGEDVCRLWTAFAAFGLGVDANPIGPNSTAPINGFAVPTACRTDVWGKDKPWDTGLEPDPATAANPMWESEDIWVRNSPVNGPHENPEFGQPNYVHVKVRNRSTVDAHNVVVKLYGTNAATSTSWPLGWTEIGQATAVYVPGSTDTEVVVTWSPPAVGHYCLLARLVTPADPMTFTEIGDPNYNARQNNNVIWRNTNVVNLLPFGFVNAGFILRSTLSDAREFRVRFTELAGTTKEAFISRGSITVDLGAELTQLWQASGGKAEGVQRVSETQLRVTDPTRAYIGVKLEPLREFKLGLTFKDDRFTGGQTSDVYTSYNFGVVLEDATSSQRNAQVGGVTYYLRAAKL
ncbi:extracellular metalloproteinase [Myxococcus sp. K15C18031901]|uniref:M36 family metallopeptidase n=1 Tax=Myxococcus dinghuensis TaxID=2906761 RepID=UPI0020A7E220|nr:M36 family metallopeptidase [Myxococcus dinghuensis]MCP3102550.1 extracellular metalloproteinase [Myxococcus dinghuensis]